MSKPVTQVLRILPKVYIAGPITLGGELLNIRRGIETWEYLLASGLCTPFCPHFGVLIELRTGMTHRQWLNYDLQWVMACHALVRLPGESKGADEEEQFANLLKIPVFNFEKIEEQGFWGWCRRWIDKLKAGECP